MGQWIQDGKRNIFETNLIIKELGKDLTIENDEVDLDKLNYLSGKTVSYVNEKAFKGTLEAHKEGGVPNLVIEFDKLDEYNIGNLIYFFEKACAISGYIQGINPFDQPGVEMYKKNMFKLLGKPE
jgi:glucose-6-phosphate isomerase (EC 5.3.1.9)